MSTQTLAFAISNAYAAYVSKPAVQKHIHLSSGPAVQQCCSVCKPSSTYFQMLHLLSNTSWRIHRSLQSRWSVTVKKVSVTVHFETFIRTHLLHYISTPTPQFINLHLHFNISIEAKNTRIFVNSSAGLHTHRPTPKWIWYLSILMLHLRLMAKTYMSN